MKKKTVNLMEGVCPLCNGSGYVLVRQMINPEHRKLAREMKAKGMTYRAIAKLLGIDHPQKIKSMIEANISTGIKE